MDPLSDIEIINTELCLADQETLDRALQKVVKVAKSGDKAARRQQSLLERVMAHVDQGRPVRALQLTEEENEEIADLHLLTDKPTLYIANVEESGMTSNKWLKELTALAEREGSKVIPVCAAIEAEIAELEEEEKKEFLKDLNIEEPGLNRIIRAGYKLLGLQTFFTAGPKEVRAWTIRVGDTAPMAAGRIHTDFEKGFIRAEVIAFDDYIACGGEAGAKEGGKWRLEGREYIVQDGDVMLFRFNV